MNENYPRGSTPPKSAGKIRAVLKAIIKANEPVEPGPLARGLGKFDWVVAQSFRRAPPEYLAELRRSGIEYYVRKDRGQSTVFVRSWDTAAARVMYEKNLCAKEPQARTQTKALTPPSALPSTAMLGSGVGLVAGAFCGIGVSLGTGVRSLEFPFPATFMAAGAILGLFFGALIHEYHRNQE